jgi:phenylpropionate dioxygenase-like ring-hydroxylating dioxygenase large terminal subunit
MTNAAITTTDRLVDAERGIISREIFVSDGIFAEELEKLFARAWLFVGHESQIPEPGDYFTSRMGTESVILCRDKTRRIHVFLNTCRHRGMKVCRYDQGNTPLFTCPYHNWSYASDGRLVGVPMHKELYPDLDRSAWSLIEVPRMVNYKGAIFASWDAQTPEFVDYLGDARDHLDQVLDCRDGREGGSEVFGGVHKWIIPANWKFAAENFCGDTYHNPSHRSVDLIGIGPSSAKGGTSGRRDNEYQGGRHVWVSFPSGHGVHSVWMPPNPPYVETFQDNRIVADYFRHCYHERTRRLGDKARLLPFTGTIFPNTSYHGRQPRALCVWHPVSATQTEVWRFFLVDRDAPAEVKDLLRRYYMRYAGPAGMTEQDDMENWNYATAASRGTIARRYPYNYQASLGRARDNDPVPGNVSTQVTEENARGFYRSWQRYLDGADWPALIGRPAPQETRAAAE